MIRLEKVDPRNVWGLLKLSVDESQTEFVATNTESIVEAYLTVSAGGYALPYGIFNDDTPVGFLMIGYDTDPEWDGFPAIAKSNYCIWRLMIDKSFQHKGYGKKALELAMELIQTKPCGEAEYCYLSYEPENEVAKAMYHAYGFRETGDMDGSEIIAALKL